MIRSAETIETEIAIHCAVFFCYSFFFFSARSLACFSAIFFLFAICYSLRILKFPVGMPTNESSIPHFHKKVNSPTEKRDTDA